MLPRTLAANHFLRPRLLISLSSVSLGLRGATLVVDCRTHSRDFIGKPEASFLTGFPPGALFVSDQFPHWPERTGGVVPTEDRAGPQGG